MKLVIYEKWRREIKKNNPDYKSTWDFFVKNELNILDVDYLNTIYIKNNPISYDYRQLINKNNPQGVKIIDYKES